jgi:hypothetical protein
MTWPKFPKLRKEQNQWDNPEASTGIFIRFIGKNVCYEATGPVREIFDQQLGNEIKAILDGCGNPLQQTVIWSIYMIGRTREYTAPKVIFSCTDEAARKEVRKTIIDSGILRRYPGIGTGDSSLPPDFNALIQQLAIADIECASEYGSVAKNAVLCTTSDITFGKQIFIKGYNGASQTLRRATAGGIVRFKDESYYLTVAHAFETRENIPSAEMGDCPFEIDFDGQSDADDDYVEDADVESTGRGSLTPEDARTEDGVSSDDDSDVSTQMDDTVRSHNPGIHIPDFLSTNDRLISLTPRSTMTEQPADAPTFLELVGDLALTSSDDPNSSLDVALIKLRNQNVYTVNEIPLGSKPGAPRLYSERIAKIESEDAEIVTVTASGGLLRGRLSATPTYMRLPHSKNFQKVYTIRLDGAIVDGDCGSLVINHANGDLYGHIIAGSLGTGTAYIIPATQVFEDLGRHLGGAVSLPTRDSLPSLCQQDALSSPIVSEISGPDKPGVGAQSYNNRDRSMDPGPAGDDCEKQEDLDSDDDPRNKGSDLEDECRSRNSLPRTKPSGSPEDPSLPIVARNQSPPASSSPMPPSVFSHYLGTSHDGKSVQGIPRELPYDQTALPFGEEDHQERRWPHPDCGRVFEDLKKHLLTHQPGHPLKFPVPTCENHTNEAHKYDTNRHNLAMNSYGSLDSIHAFAPLPYSLYENPSFYFDTPPENFQSEMYRSASLNGSLKPSSHHSSEFPPSTLSSASGHSISSASSYAVGPPYSGHAHTFSHQESWVNPTEGLGQNACYQGFVGMDLDSELAFGSHDKLSDDFLGECANLSSARKSSGCVFLGEFSSIPVPLQPSLTPSPEPLTIESILERANSSSITQSPQSPDPSHVMSIDKERRQSMKPTSLFKPSTTPASACPRIPKVLQHLPLELPWPPITQSSALDSPTCQMSPSPVTNMEDSFRIIFFAQSSGSFMPPLESSCVFFSSVVFLSLFFPAYQTFALRTLPLGNDVANRHFYNRSIPHSSFEECEVR